MFSNQKKNKKKYSNSKLHFIIFLTSKKPLNLSISKWVVYSATCVLLLAILTISVFSYNTYIYNASLDNNIDALEKEIKQLQVDNLKLGVENTNLKGSLDDKTLKVSDALQELETLQSSIKEIKEIVGLPVEEDGETVATSNSTETASTPSVRITSSKAGSRSMTSLRSYNDQSVSYSDGEVKDDFESIEELIQDTKKELEELLISAEDRKHYLENTPTLFPASGRISSNYGARWGGLHRGVDISNSLGTKIYAAGDGVVLESKYGYSFGHYVLIRHENGFETRYAHLSKRLVKAGEEVKQGDLIGLMGNTGTSYGCHLHYEITLYGKLIDPLKIENYLKYKE